MADHVRAVAHAHRVADHVPRADSVTTSQVAAAHAPARVPVAHVHRVLMPRAEPLRSVRVADVVHHQQ